MQMDQDVFGHWPISSVITSGDFHIAGCTWAVLGCTMYVVRKFICDRESDQA